MVNHHAKRHSCRENTPRPVFLPEKKVFGRLRLGPKKPRGSITGAGGVVGMAPVWAGGGRGLPLQPVAGGVHLRAGLHGGGRHPPVQGPTHLPWARPGRPGTLSESSEISKTLQCFLFFAAAKLIAVRAASFTGMGWGGGRGQTWPGVVGRGHAWSQGGQAQPKGAQAWSGVVKRGQASSGVVRRVQHGEAWSGVVRRGQAWSGVVRRAGA